MTQSQKDQIEAITGRRATPIWTPGQAIVISTYSDTMSIYQGNNSISLNYESLNEFIKNLKNAAKNR